MRWRDVYAYFFATSFLASFLLVPACRRLARHIGLLDHPGPRKIHERPTPLLGGLAILLAFFLVLWGHLLACYLASDGAALHSYGPENFLYYFRCLQTVYPEAATVFAGGVLIFTVGLLDDRRHLSIRARLLAEFVVAGLVVVFGIRPRLGFLPDPAVQALAIVWIVGITNAFNLLDGADGLAAGVAIISSLTLAFVMALGHEPMAALLLVALAGATAGFLRYNLPPASIFLGSAGSMFLGYLLGATVLVATYMTRHTTTLFPILIPVLVLGVPLYDTASVVFIRLARGQSIVLADQNHLIHRLVRMGFSYRQGVLFIYLITFCVAINAALLVGASLRDSLVIMLQIAGLFLILVVIERVSMKRAREIEAERGGANAAAGGEATPAPRAAQPVGAGEPRG